MKEKKRTKMAEWAHSLAIMVPTVIILFIMRVPTKWENSIVATISVFYTVLLFSKNNWKYAIFWRALIILFIVHCAGHYILNFYFLPKTSYGFRGIPLIIFCLWEILIIYGILNRLSMGKPIIPLHEKHTSNNDEKLS
jgi:membrane-associated HD superfamily phosphohydrolase